MQLETSKYSSLSSLVPFELAKVGNLYTKSKAAEYILSFVPVYSVHALRSEVECI